jgi:hypothetical protein
LNISFGCWFRIIRVPLCVFWSPSVSIRDDEGPGDCESGVFIAEEFDGAEAEGSGDTTIVSIDTLGELFPNLRLFSSATDIRICGVSASELKEF